MAKPQSNAITWLPPAARRPVAAGWLAAAVASLVSFLVSTTADSATALGWFAVAIGAAAALVAGYDTALRTLEAPRARPSWDTLVGLAAAWLVCFSVIHPGEAWAAPTVLALHRTMTWLQHGSIQRQRRALEDPVSLVLVHVVPVSALVAIPLDLYALGASPGPAVAAVLLAASPRMHAFSRMLTLKRARQRARDLGIRVKRRATLFNLRPPMTIVFVPEATLFEEQPRLRELVPVPGKRADELVALAAAWALLSDAPESDAILEEAHRLRTPVREAAALRTFAGLGVVFESGAHAITIGNTRLLRDRGVSLTSLEETLVRTRSEGRRPLLIARDRELLGALIMEDPPRRDAVRTIKVFQKLGLRCAVLTGQPEAEYQVLAEQCGIHRVLGDVDPEDRPHALDTLRGETIHKAALVTPALHEPALAGADVGIYFKPGEREWFGRAHVLVGTGGLMGLAWLFLITEAARTTHRIGIAWTALYHVVAISIAMTGLLHPVLAAVGANLAWLLLVVNANHLRRFAPEKAVEDALERRTPYQP